MKKLIIVLAVGIIATEAMSQTDKKTAPPAPPQVKDMPIPPPATPTLPEEVQFIAPPPPPSPPPPPKVRFTPPVIVNEKSYAIMVQSTKEEPVIILKKKGMVQKIRMSVWNAKPVYFENKYGKLPPPPPPAPQILPIPPAKPVKE